MISQNKQQKQIEMAWRNVRDVETAQSDPPSLKLDKVPQITTCQVTLKYPYKHLIYCTVKIRKDLLSTPFNTVGCRRLAICVGEEREGKKRRWQTLRRVYR